MTASKGSEYASLDISYVSLAKFTLNVSPEIKSSTLNKILNENNVKNQKEMRDVTNGGFEELRRVSSVSLSSSLCHRRPLIIFTLI